MDKTHIIEREAGIEYVRLQSWFDSQPHDLCRVTIEPLSPRALGPTVVLPRTLLCIEGPAEEVAALYRRFELQFMSAGG